MTQDRQDRPAQADATGDPIARLAAADPIKTTALPSPDGAAAQQLMKGIMATSSESPAETHLDLPEVPGIDRYRSASRNRLAFLGVVAAAIVLIAGFVIFAPSNTDPALAAVHNAAAATAQVESGRATTTLSFTGSDGETTETLRATAEAEYSGDDFAVVIDGSEALDVLGDRGDGLPAGIEARMVDGVFYGRDGVTWYSIDAGQFVGGQAAELVDPRSVLEQVQQLVDTVEVGSEVIDGVDTTHYQSVVDLGDETLQQSGWLPIEGLDAEVDGEVTIDLYVDADGRLRQMMIVGDLAETGGPGTGSAEIVTSFYDIGADISIEAPADATPIDDEIDFDAPTLED